jgi:hypothetical protein
VLQKSRDSSVEETISNTETMKVKADIRSRKKMAKSFCEQVLKAEL